MHPVFSINGQHVAWLIDNFLYNIGGYPIGYALGGSIFSTNGQHIGQIESGEYFMF